MSVMRTVTDSRGARWSVRDIAGGVEDWTLIGGSAKPEFRAGGSCGLAEQPSRARSTRAVTRARSAVANSSSRRVGLVVLTAQARQQIIDELVRWEDGEHEARESGGWLVGRFEAGRKLVITAAYGAGPEAAHSYGSMTLPLDYTRSVANSLCDGERIVGDYHSHSDAKAPSRADKRAWARLAEKSASPHCGLLVARNGSDWRYPKFASYLSRGDEHRVEQPELEVQRWRQ